MYKIIGSDDQEYGPVTDDDVRQWIGEGRLNGKSRAKAGDEAEFRALETFPEFAGALAAQARAQISPVNPDSSAGFQEHDYQLDFVGCFSQGWNLLKAHFGVLFVAALLYSVIEGAISGLGQIPVLGTILALGNLVIAGPLMGGVFYIFIMARRGQPVEVGDVFSGFRRAFTHLFLGYWVTALLAGLCLIPYLLVFGVKLVPVIEHLGQALNNQAELQKVLAEFFGIFIHSLPLLLICLVPVVYLKTCWEFTLPLVVDKQMDAWTAMKTSWKMVNKHWWQVFGLVVLIGLLNLAGMCACCVGVFITFPIGVAALMAAYEIIFNETQKD